VDDDPVRLYRTFVTLVLLTRGIAEQVDDGPPTLPSAGAVTSI